MNIAFDGTALLGPMSKNRGIGNYAMGQIRNVIRQDKENKYFFFNVFEEKDFFEDEVREGLLQEDDFLCIKDGSFLSSPGFENVFGALVQRYIKKNNIDVFYITSPFETKIPVYQKEWFRKTRVATIVYDIIPYVMKEQYFPDPANMVWYMERVDMLRWADRLLVISQSVKDDLIQYLNFNGEKIDVIWGAPDPKFQKLEIENSKRKKLLDKYKIDSPYVMCAGGDDKRKNIEGLIEAFGMLPSTLKKQYQIVIVCKLSAPSIQKYTDAANIHGCKGRVIFTNFVTDEELVQLYNLAYLVAFPSQYEGFGLPVVEAWSCGTPVLTSKNSSLGQIARDAAVLVDPESVTDIARGLKEALTKCDLQELKRRGMERVKQFQWPVVAKATIDSFQTLRRSSREISKRYKIAFFTPLPPVQSGISDYSVDILCALNSRFDIDVYIDVGYAVNCNLPKNISVYPHSEYKNRHRLYRETVYQIGNSEYHIYMWPYLKKYGGTLVLHDYNLHDVIQYEALAMQKNNRAFYRELLSEDLTSAEINAHMDLLDHGICQPLELNGFVVNYADKIVVHSQDNKEKLLEKDIGRTVYWIRSYAKIEPLAEPFGTPKKLGLETDTILFAAFGHVQESKRVIPILRAFARLAKQYEMVRLLFAGKLNSTLEKQFPVEVVSLGISDLVKVTGYVDLADFEQYIDAADVCLNLRWPYHGETSGSLMRILAKGKCVIVNDVGSFGEIPDDACVKIPSAEGMTEALEVQEIYNAMERLVAQVDTRKEIQRTARKFAEKCLDINVIADQYAEVILSQPQRVITEELLTALKNELQGGAASSEQVQRIARTLAYVKTDNVGSDQV